MAGFNRKWHFVHTVSHCFHCIKSSQHYIQFCTITTLNSHNNSKSCLMLTNKNSITTMVKNLSTFNSSRLQLNAHNNEQRLTSRRSFHRNKCICPNMTISWLFLISIFKISLEILKLIQVEHGHICHLKRITWLARDHFSAQAWRHIRVDNPKICNASSQLHLLDAGS